jgi:hypothetical protein
MKKTVKSNSKKTVKNVAKKVTNKTAKKVKANPNKKANYSKRTQSKIDRVKQYDNINNESVWKALLVTSAEAELQDMGLSKAIKVFTKLLAQKRAITPQIKQALAFKNVCEFLKDDKKYGHLQYFSKHQIVLICSRLLKNEVASVKLSAKVVKQKATTKRALNSAKMAAANKMQKVA